MSARAILFVAALTGVLGCELTPPDRPAGYPFHSQAGNLVFHWPASRMPVRYWSEAEGALPDYLDDGIRQWEAQFLYGEFTGTRISDSAAADVRVEMAGAAPPAAPLTAAPPVNACSGLTSIGYGNNQVILPIVIHVQWFPGFTPEQVANCLARVTTHEIGHSLGLLQHSADPGDIMYGAPFGNVTVREPSLRDGVSVQRLYHTSPDLAP